MESLEQAAGDGMEAVAPRDAEQELKELKESISEIRTTVADDIAARRATARETLWCEWSGQSDDGRKRAESLGYDAEPFEGASDNRVRLAERLAREHTMQKVAAATRATPKAIGTESNDTNAAARIETLIQWLIRNQWGSDYRRQCKLLAWWQEVDTPAGSVCMVDWEREFSIRLTRVTPEDVIGLYLAQVGQQATEEDAASAAQIVYNWGREADLVALLQSLYPDMRPARAKKAAKQLYEEGEAEIPEKYAKVNMPRIAAKRLYYDIFFHANTTDIQRARVVFHREWLSKAEVLERAATNEWNEEFVEELIGDGRTKGGHEAESAWETSTDAEAVLDDLSESDRHTGMYEVLTAYRRAATEDGAIGIYVTTFSGLCNTAAKETELFERSHGKYPFVYFAREVLSERLIDSRGIPEVYQSQQQTLKLLKDSFEDFVQINMQPPLMGPEKARFKLTFGPKAFLPKGARETYEYLQRPPYPQAADKYWEETRREINEEDGRPGDDIDPALVQLATQDRVDEFLAPLADVFAMVVQLCQEFMTDADVQRVVGGAGMPIARSSAEIQGKYDIRLSFDVRDMDMEGVIGKAKVILENLKPLDVRAILPYEQIVSRLLAAIDPNLADMVASVETADAREISDERAIFVGMLNGVEGPMPEGGINAALRLQVEQQLIGERQSNPAAYPPVSPIAMAMIENRMKYLQFQQSQMQNASIGRVGTEPVKAQEVNVGSAGASPAGAAMGPAGAGGV
jgi:hypothetical protein